MRVYCVLYSDCVYESSYRTVSLHRTKEGAVAAMKSLKDHHFIGHHGGYDSYIEHQGFRYGAAVVHD